MGDVSDSSSERRLLDALARVPALVAVLRGPKLVYEYVNERYKEVLDPQDLIGKPFGDSGHVAAPLLHAMAHRVRATGEPWLGREVRVPHRGRGELVDAFYNIDFVPLRGSDGAIDGVLIHSFDVTELVRARQHVAEKEERLRRLVDSNLLGVAFVGPGGDVLTYANDEFLRITGYDRVDLAAGRIRRTSLTAPEFVGHDEQKLSELRAHGVFTPFEKEYVRRDGARVPVLVGGARFDPPGTGAVLFVLDSTERKRAEREHAELQEKLLQVQKLESLGLLSGGIAHDFNNMLAAILGSIACAARTLPHESPAQAFLDDAIAAGQRASQLTRQLLAYSGRGRFQTRAIDLSLHVRELTHLLETTLPKKARLVLDLAPDLPAVVGDPAQLQQIVMNLVINAAEAIDAERGCVRVSTGVVDVDDAFAASALAPGELGRGPHVFLEVRDDGVGMDAETRSKIFDPFYTTKFTGRGLGLAAVLGIARAHRGAIRVESEPGRGTTFTVVLPASSVARDAPAPPSRSERRDSGLLLVIDDDQAVRVVLGRLLEMKGFDVVEAADGAAGVATFMARPRDVVAVIVDLTMPGMSGAETMRALRSIRADVPIILTSGYDESEATCDGMPATHTAFLEKPFTATELEAALDRALGTSGSSTS